MVIGLVLLVCLMGYVFFLDPEPHVRNSILTDCYRMEKEWTDLGGNKKKYVRVRCEGECSEDKYTLIYFRDLSQSTVRVWDCSVDE